MVRAAQGESLVSATRDGARQKQQATKGFHRLEDPNLVSTRFDFQLLLRWPSISRLLHQEISSKKERGQNNKA
jgi:hypothetical protein